MTRRALTGILACLLPALLSPSASSSAPQSVRLTAPVTLPFELVIRHIVLPVTINGSRPLSFVLDTGAKAVIVDLGRAKELGLSLSGEIRAGGVGSELTTGQFVKNAECRLPGLADFAQPVTLALTFGRLTKRFGHDFDGVIGTDFIRQFVVELDYASRVIKLHDRETFVYSGPGESVPARMNASSHPVVEAEVTPVGRDRVAGRFVIDVGSGGALALHSPFVTEHGLPGPGVKTIRALGIGGAGGASSGRLGRIAALKIGRFTLANPTTIFSQDTAGAFANSAIQGNIGQQIMSRFKVFLDLSRERILFEPLSRFSDPFDRAISGISLMAEGADYKTFRVDEVLEDSPASEAGLQPNDVIAAIDGRAATDLTLTAVLELFDRSASYALTVQRGDRTLQLKLSPRQLF
jgi:hypothetical protein